MKKFYHESQIVKAIWFCPLAIKILCLWLVAVGQVAPTRGGASEPSPIAAAPVEIVASRTGNTQMHQRIEERLVDRELVRSTNEWTVVQPGIGYWSDEEQAWKASTTEIELAEVGAVYRKGPFQLKFPADYTTGPIEFTLPDKRIVKIQTMGLALRDGESGESVWLGEARSTAGFLDRNTIIYPDAFSGIKADIVAKVGIGRWENDIVIREQTVSPQALGWKPEKAVLEIWHRIIEMPEAEIGRAPLTRADRSVELDEQLSFGDTFLGPGTAFLVGENQAVLATGEGGIQVSKERYVDPDANAVYLIEKVPFREAAAHLQTLPARRQAHFDRESLQEKLKSARAVVSKGKRPLSIASLKTRTNTPKKKVRV